MFKGTTPAWRPLGPGTAVMLPVVVALCAGLCVPTPARAEPIPAPIPAQVEQMIRAAARDNADLDTVAKIAKRTSPRSAREIDALVKRLKTYAAAHRRYALQRQGFFTGWKGQGEVGASDSAGNTRSTSMAVGLHYTRDGLNWDHALTATGDYQRDNGVESKSRYFASYSGHYNITPRFYTLGLLSWENDRFAGFDQRFSESVGLGVAVIKTPRMTLALEAGPALRQTHYITLSNENKLAGRASLNYRWEILPKLVFTQVASFYAERQDSTTVSDTGLTAGLIGSLSVRLSYHLQYESRPPLGLNRTDTTTRLTLVYDF